MKGFFKKLSLVLAAAMIITMIPAQAAKAEGTIKLAYQKAGSVSEAITYDTLKVGEKQDYKFYGCVDYKTTGTGWVSSNEAVATVDSKGEVTAIAAGSTQIAYTAKGYKTEAITLVVASEYDVQLADQTTKEVKTAVTLKAIGETYDFCFVNAKGYALGTHKCSWVSTNPAVATVNNVGLVTAVSEGTAKIVLTIVNKATGAVAFAVAPADVTVQVAKLEAKQDSYNTATVTFNGEAPADTVAVWSVVDGERQVEYVERSGKTVSFYNELVSGREYIFVYGDQEASFVASIAPVASMKLSTKSQLPDQINGKVRWIEGAAYVGQPTQVQISDFVDAAGIAVKRSNYTIEFTDLYNDLTTINYDGVIYIGEKGEKHVVTVTAIDNKTGEKISETITVIGEEIPSIYIKKETVAAKVATRGTTYDKSGTQFKLSIDDEATYGIALTLKDSRENTYKYSAGLVQTGLYDDATLELLRDIGQFVFESTNYDVLGVTDTGVLEARKEGKATILVYFEYVDDDLTQTQKVLLTSVPFEVIGHLVPTTVSLKEIKTNMVKNGTYVRLADMPGACNFNWATIQYTVKDQLGRDLACDVTVDVTNTYNSADGDIFLDLAPITNGVEIVALDNDTDKSSINYNFRFKFSKWGVTKTASASLMVVNIDEAKLSQVPGVAMCIEDKASGIGNTDNTNLLEDEDVTVGIHIVDVYYVNNANTYVYGYDVWQTAVDEDDPVLVRNYSEIKNMSKSADFAAKEAQYPEAYYVEITLDGKLLDIDAKYDIDKYQTDGNSVLDANDPVYVTLQENEHCGDAVVTRQYIQVVIRNAFKNLVTNDQNDTIYAQAIADARKLASIASVKLTANVWDLYNTNTMETSQVTTTWKKGACSKYDSVGTVEYLNNDVKNYAAAITIDDLTYQGDIPRDRDGWADWFDGHTSLSANVWKYGKADAYKSGVAYDYKFFVEDEAGNPLYTFKDIDPRFLYYFDVTTMTQNSKYIQAAGLFFTLYDSDANVADSVNDEAHAHNLIVTYVPYSIGKKVTQQNYEYKVENERPDGEFPGIWAD